MAHVSKILKTILQYRLIGHLNNCKFYMSKVGFIGFIVTPEGVTMEPGKTSCIIDWPEPKRHQDVQRFLGFANFY